MAKKNTAAIAEELAAPILEEMGLQLWDVVYEKEGSGWYLRYYVDKEGGIDINSCEAFSPCRGKGTGCRRPHRGQLHAGGILPRHRARPHPRLAL